MMVPAGDAAFTTQTTSTLPSRGPAPSAKSASGFQSPLIVAMPASSSHGSTVQLPNVSSNSCGMDVYCLLDGLRRPAVSWKM